MSQAKIDQRNGIPKPSTWEERVAYEQRRKERRLSNVANAREILKKFAVSWVEFIDSAGFIFHVQHDGMLFKYRPETGEWQDRNGKPRYGCRNFIKHLQGEK